MRLSTKGRFAVTAMIEVALYERQGPVPLSDIAARQQISLLSAWWRPITSSMRPAACCAARRASI